MNMIYENRRRTASNDPFARAFLLSLRFIPLREKCRYSEFFWSIYSRIRTEYWDIVFIFPYSAGMIRSGHDQKNSKYGHFSRSLCFDFCFCSLLNTSLYCNNIESHAEKNGKYCLGCEALLIDRVFENIFWQYFR